MSRSETVVRTVLCPLETSNRKKEKLQRGVRDFRSAAQTAANLLPSFQEQTWTRNNNQIYRTVKGELEDYTIKDKVIQNAVHRVIDNFNSAKEREVSLPKNGIPECDFLILTNQGYSIEPNERGYGLKANFIPYKPEWWHLDIGDYHRQYLNGAIHGDMRFGNVELAYNDGDPVARIAVTWEQSITTVTEAEYIVGVDIGYNTLYAAVVRERESGEVVDVTVRTGNEFQHRRKRLQDRLTRFKESGKLDRAEKVRNKQRNFTKTTLHQAARELVSFAQEHEPCLIAIEDIHDYREKDRENTMHDWPYSQFQDRIEEKAHAEGIGVQRKEPFYTSQTCSECGLQDSENRDGNQFECIGCGYQVNADVNAAKNISKPQFACP